MTKRSPIRLLLLLAMPLLLGADGKPCASSSTKEPKPAPAAGADESTGGGADSTGG